MASEWPQVPLGEVITLQRGFDLPSQDRKPGRVPILSSSGITDYHSEVGVPGPGVVTGRYGTIGQVFLSKEDFWPLNTTLWVKNFHGNDLLWASYLLRTIDFMSCSDKSSVPGVNRNDLHRILVLLPPLDEQRAIAGVLGALDDKIDQNRRTARALDRLARTIFRAWFVDFEPVKAKAAGAASFPSLPQPVFDALPTRFVDSEIGPVPEGWEVQPIDDVITVKGGGTPSTKNPNYWDGGEHCWATPRDMSRLAHPVLLDTERRITDAGVKHISSGLLPVGTVLMSSRAPVGYLAIAGVPTAINQGFIAMICDGPLPPIFVLNWVSSSMEAIKARASGTTFPEISKRNFRTLTAVKPTGDVIVAYQRAAEPLFDLLTARVKENVCLAKIRDYILPRLLSGQVRVEVTNG